MAQQHVIVMSRVVASQPNSEGTPLYCGTDKALLKMFYEFVSMIQSLTTEKWNIASYYCDLCINILIWHLTINIPA